MIVLLYKCSLLGHTFFFLLTIFVGYFFISATFLTKQRMTTFWSFGCLSLTLILIIVCLQNEALLKAAFFVTSGNGLWNYRKKMMPSKSSNLPKLLCNGKKGKTYIFLINIYKYNTNYYYYYYFPCMCHLHSIYGICNVQVLCVQYAQWGTGIQSR